MPRGTVEVKGLQVELLGHTSVGIYGKTVTYIDPFSEVLKGQERKANLIVSTHNHRDHYDIAAINQLSDAQTVVVVKSGCDASNLVSKSVKSVEVEGRIVLDNVTIASVPAYNIKRFRSPGTPFHPVGFGMGVVLMLEGVRFYYAGDTDFIEPMRKLKGEKIDVAFLPIGGTYTMDIDEAVEATREIDPKIVLPVHYNHIKGTEADPFEFKKKVEKVSKAQVMVVL